MRKGMVAILSRIFTVPDVTPFTAVGLFIVVLGGLVCFFAVPVKNKITGREHNPEQALPIKLVGLALAVAGFIITAL